MILNMNITREKLEDKQIWIYGISLLLALALPDSWATLAAAVIVTQTIVELVGELFYIRVIPKYILKDHTESNV